MLESLFGGKTVEKILFFLLMNGQCYGQELARTFQEALSPFQKGLDRLEAGGVLVSFLIGKTRSYQFNPRYPYLNELRNFLSKAYEFIPQEQKEQIYEPPIRKRPRRRGKPL